MFKAFTKIVFIGFLLTTAVQAQQSPVAKRNDNGATTLQNTNLGNVPLAADLKGRAIVAPGQTPVNVSVIGTISPPAAEVTPVAMATIIPTALPTAFSTPQFTNSSALKTRTIYNGTNQDVWCSNAQSTPAPFIVAAGSSDTQNLAANGQQLSVGIGCIHPANTPASGAVYIWGSK